MPKFRSVRSKGFQHAAVAIALAAAGAIAAVWVLTIERTRYEREEAIEQTQRRTEHLALAYEQDILRTLQVVDQMVRYVRYEYAVEGTGFDLKAAFAEGWINGDLFAYAAVIDANGRVVLGSSNPSPFDVSDRDYFRFHRDHANDVLHVGVQTASRVDGRPSVQFSRRIDTRPGEFGGVAMVAVPPALLVDMHRRLDIGTHGLVALIGLDGVARIRRAGNEITFGLDYRASTLLQRARSEPRGSYVTQGRRDTVERFVSYRTLNGYPFVALVGVSVDDALAEVQARTRSQYLIAVGTTLLILLVGMGFLLAVQRQKAVAEEKRRSEALYRATFDQAAVGVAHADPSGRFLRVNPKLCEMLGYTEEELLRLSWLDVTHPEDAGRAARLVAKMLADPGVRLPELEKRYRCKDGTERCALASIALVRGADGQPEYFVSVLQDITDRKRAESAAEESELRFRQLAENIGEVFWLTDPSKNEVLYVSPAYEQIWGRSCESVYASPRDWIEAIHVEDRARVLLAAQQQAAGNYDEEYRVVRPDGSTRWIRDRAFPVLRDGRVYRVTGIAEDITDRKRAGDELRESERRFRDMLGNVELISMTLDREARITYCNDYLLRLTGWRREELIGKNWFDVFIPADINGSMKGVFAGLLENLPPYWHYENEIVTRAGERRLIRWNNSVLRSASGEVSGTASIGEDITESKRAQEAIQRADARYRATFDQAGVGIVHASLEGRFMRVNRKMCDMLGYEEAELVGRGFAAVTHPEDGKLTADPVAALRDSADATAMPEYEKRYVCRDGRTLWGAVSLSLVRDAQGRPEYFIALVKDVTARKEAEEKLIYRAHYDPLTDLPNRTLFYDRLAQVLNQARRHDWTFGVMVIDLDRFKSVNDTLGHSHGDRLLQDVAKRLSQCLRSGDTVARVGGDEFAIVAADLARAQDAAILAQKVLESLAKPFDLDGHEVFIGASVGIATFPMDGCEGGLLIKNADAALYRAKELGRNNYQFYTAAMNERAMENLLLENDLRHALERREFRLHFQPKARLRDGRVAGFEALLRWERPGKGLVSPAQFVPLLEDTGLIVPVGDWVIRAAFAQLREWREEGREPLPVAVNLAAKQFVHHDIVAVVEAAIRESGMPAELLEVEITESDAMKNPEQTLAVLQRLEARGVRIAIDDFGTGYSSLSYLKRFPVHTVKLDRSFVKGLPDDTEDASIALAVVTMAHSLGLEVVAEGVETAAQKHFLAEHGCDQMQGYLLSRPLPAAECARFFGAPQSAMAA